MQVAGSIRPKPKHPYRDVLKETGLCTIIPIREISLRIENISVAHVQIRNVMRVIQAHIGHLDDIARLFDQYRVFYQQPSDLSAARAFLQERFQNADSVIFAVREGEQMIGFTQLYPSFSSVTMQPIWILNDLFVEESFRQRGVAKALLEAAKTFTQRTGAGRIIISTQISNIAAQSLYESLGYRRDEDFYHYVLPL